MSAEEAVDYVTEGITLFSDEMKRQGIHVGIGVGGGKVVCPVDGQEWPCSSQPNHVCRPARYRGEKIGWQCDCGKVLR